MPLGVRAKTRIPGMKMPTRVTAAPRRPCASVAAAPRYTANEKSGPARPEQPRSQPGRRRRSPILGSRSLREAAGERRVHRQRPALPIDKNALKRRAQIGARLGFRLVGSRGDPRRARGKQSPPPWARERRLRPRFDSRLRGKRGGPRWLRAQLPGSGAGRRSRWRRPKRR